MTKSEKTNIKRGVVVLALSFLLFIPAIVLNFVNAVPSYAAHWPNATHGVYLPAIKPVTAVIRGMVIEPIGSATPVVANITIPIIIVNKNITQPPLTKKIWVCGEPRDLEMGSGQVKECEWK